MSVPEITRTPKDQEVILTLDELREIVFDKKKCPQWTRQYGERRIMTVVDHEGLHTYTFVGDGDLDHGLIPFDEIKLEDIQPMAHAIGRRAIDQILMEDYPRK